MDIDAERAEAQLDALIERRALEAEEANREARAWAASAQRHDLRRAAEIRREWVSEDLAERHRAELGRTLDGAAGRARAGGSRPPHKRGAPIQVRS